MMTTRPSLSMVAPDILRDRGDLRTNGFDHDLAAADQFIGH